MPSTERRTRHRAIYFLAFRRYFFVKNIGTMLAKEFLDPTTLTAFLKSLLAELGEWLISQSAAITAHLNSPKPPRP